MDEEITPVPAPDAPEAPKTASDLLADEILEAIIALAARIPKLEGPHATTASHVRGGRTVPEDAIMSMIAAVNAEPQLQQLGTFNVDDALAMLQFNAAFRHVVDRLEFLTASVTFTMEAWKARVAFDLMRTYGIMKSIARKADSGGLINHVENVRRDLGRKSGRAPAEPVPPAETE